MDGLSQCSQILAYIREHGSITQREAATHIGCWRLSARIHDLKRRGSNIVTDMVTVKARDGGFCRIARYREVQDVSML